MKIFDYANIVNPAEMQDAGQWLADMREALTADARPDATYELTDADTGRKRRVAGRELTEKGLPVVMKTAPAGRLVFYKRMTK